jgi:hypothetical protein
MIGIPFFYYDIIARMLPGGITLAVLALAVPEIRGLVSGAEAWKAAVVPIALAAASYMIGVLFEAVYPDWLIWKWVGDMTFKSAAKEYHWQGKTQKPDLDDLKESRTFRDEAWFDLVLAGKRDEAQAFVHALRFWAEAKMCLHSLLPVFAAAIIFQCEQKSFWGIAATVVAGLLLWGVYSRDKRRWVQILNSRDRLNLGECSIEQRAKQNAPAVPQKKRAGD